MKICLSQRYLLDDAPECAKEKHFSVLEHMAEMDIEKNRKRLRSK